MSAGKGVEQALHDLAGDYQLECRRHADAVAALRAREQLTLPAESYNLAIRAEDHKRDDQETAERFAERLLRYAELRFAPAGARLEIDRAQLREDRSIYPEEGPPDLLALWKRIEAAYGGDRGSEEAYRQIAGKLVRAFHLDGAPKVVQKGGYVVLNHDVWLDAFDRQHSHVNNLSYHCLDGVTNAYGTLAAFARWAGHDALAEDLERGATRWHKDKRITSRERSGFGEDGTEIEVVTYTGRFEFRISNVVAEQLRVFLGSYGPPIEPQEAAEERGTNRAAAGIRP